MDILTLFTTIAIYCSNPGLCSTIVNPEDKDRVKLEICTDQAFSKMEIGIVDFNDPKNKKIITIVSKKCIEA